MKTHTTYLTFNTRNRHEIIDITEEVEKCRASAGIDEVMCSCGSTLRIGVHDDHDLSVEDILD